MEALERYRPIVDDFEAFRAACERRLPTTVRVNTIKAGPDRARAVLEAEGVEATALSWQPNVFAVDTDSPGATWASFHGLTHGQEAVSALPVLALDPQPGECIWDACAAPGGKATQIAAAIEDRGTVIANDNNLGRLSALRFNAERLGATSMVVTNQDARNYSSKPLGEPSVDRSLVDAPCTCEGTVRKSPDVLEEWSLERVESVAGVQKGILRRALQLTDPGGRVVYSTCTFAPEENEAVVAHALEHEDCRVVPARLPEGLETAPGLLEWGESAYDSSLELARRIYPHQNDTGGFFIAALEVAAS